MIDIRDATPPGHPMNQTPDKMRYLATRLILHETNADDSLSGENRVAAEVIEKLRPQLLDLMGNTGFHALVSRSLALAKAEAPGLAGALLNSDGRLEGFGGAPDPARPPRNSTGGSVLLTKMLGLLSSFIGELLTLQLVIEVWPNLSLDGYFSQGIENENKL